MSEPLGWTTTNIGELSSYVTSGSRDWSRYYSAAGAYFIRTQDINTNALVRWEDVARVSLPEKVEGKRTLVRGGDILITITGANVGKVAEITEAEPPEAYVSQSVALVRLIDQSMAPFVHRRLLAPSGGDTKTELEQRAYGVGRPVLSLDDVRETSVLLPPLPEQRRIVTKIDSLTGKSKRAREHLDHVHRLVEKYKQAMLAAAFDGRLIGLQSATTVLPHDACWELPQTWRWTRFENVAKIASNLTAPDQALNLPHIAPDNVEKGTGRLLPYRTVAEDGVISAKHRFHSGQIIYSKIRPYLRKAVLVGFEGVCSADMYPLTAKSNVDVGYLHYWCISEQLANFAIDHQGRTVLPKINQAGLNQTPFPLPPLLEQQAMVERLRARFMEIDRLAADAASARQLLDRLDQSILAKAFRGELVPQDPDDEPASALLDRIRAERQTAPKPRRGRKAAGA